MNAAHNVATTQTWTPDASQAAWLTAQGFQITKGKCFTFERGKLEVCVVADAPGFDPHKIDAETPAWRVFLCGALQTAREGMSLKGALRIALQHRDNFVPYA